jgi:uncharacterized RDD family membrane protein YckC
MPVYRLIRADRARWVSVPLPEDFGFPREAALVGRVGDAPPTIVARYDASSSAPLRVLRWSKPDSSGSDADATAHAGPNGDSPRPDASAQAAAVDDGWSDQYFRLPRLGNWAVAEVDGQVIVGIEQFRSASQVDVDLYVLRNSRSWLIVRLALPTDGMAQWALLGLGDRAGVLAVPGPRLMPYADGTPAPAALAGLRTVTLDGQTEEQIRPVSLHRPTPMRENVNYLFQIITYFAAMIMMMMFWRRMPGDGQLRLPERVVIASMDKRLISALLDLTPGLILASLIYGVSWMEIIMLWPGSPTDKTFAAMRPGLLVIGVTVVHTTIFELITARSIGKWLTGLYVSNYKGIPAPPGASTVRAVTRLFDLIALLLLIIPLLSPYRQRLGDILARTVVVTRLPDPEEEERKRKERERQLREQEDEY